MGILSGMDILRVHIEGEWLPCDLEELGAKYMPLP